MAYSPKSSLVKTSVHYSADQLWAAFKPMTPPSQYENAQRVFKALVPLCIAFDLDEVVLAAIIWIETGAAGSGLPFRSEWFLKYFNLGNLGITGDPAQNAAAQKWTTPEDGVLGLVAHAVAYAYGSKWAAVWNVDDYGKPQIADERFPLVLSEYGGKPLNSLEQLNNRWAVDRDDAYDMKLATRANALVAAMDDPPVTTPSTDPEPIPGEGEPMALEILNRVIGVQENAPATLLNMGPKSAVPIIHNTSNPNPGADALMHARFVTGGGGADNVSFHFCVDSKRAVQILPLNRIGYHASDGCDNRSTDVGCFNGIAFENCDNADGDIRKTFENQAELLACIEFGDSRIDYGGRPLSDFEGFIDRTLGHHDTAYDQKWCPEDYLNLFGDPGYKTQLKSLAKAKLAAKRGGTTPAEPTPVPVEEVLPGLDYAVAARLFGTAKGEDNVTYKFDKNGPVSKLWLANGKQTGQWPALVSVYSYESGARRYFVFQGGATILAAKGADPRWLKEAA